MKLQKMIYRHDGKIIKLVCAVNLFYHGGEFTFCGNAIPDNTLELNDCEAEGEEFEGMLKDLTCSSCINFIKYVKEFK